MDQILLACIYQVEEFTIKLKLFNKIMSEEAVKPVQ